MNDSAHILELEQREKSKQMALVIIIYGRFESERHTMMD
jgi:hypothetical protein